MLSAREQITPPRTSYIKERHRRCLLAGIGGEKCRLFPGFVLVFAMFAMAVCVVTDK